MAREVYTLTKREYDFFRLLMRKVYGHTPTGDHNTGGEPQYTTYVRVTGEADSSGWYPSVVTISDGQGDWTDYQAVQLLAINHETLSIGTRYEARQTGNADDGKPRYRCVAAGGGIGGAGCGLIDTDGILSVDLEAIVGAGLEVGTPGSGCPVLQLSHPEVTITYVDGSVPLVIGCTSDGRPTITYSVKTLTLFGTVGDVTGAGQTYNCVGTACEAVSDGTGTYTSLADCEAGCGGGGADAWKCGITEGMSTSLVIPDGTVAGTYTAVWALNGLGELTATFGLPSPCGTLTIQPGPFGWLMTSFCGGGGGNSYYATSLDCGPPVVATFPASAFPGSTSDSTNTT